jgi:hypothetical protein
VADKLPHGAGYAAADAILPAQNANDPGRCPVSSGGTCLELDWAWHR